MLDVSIKNKELIKTLDWFAEWMFSHDQSVLDNLKFPNCESNVEEATSIEYLRSLQEKHVLESGFPLDLFGYDINAGKISEMPDGWNSIALELDKRMISAIGVEFSALKMYYPTDGYIGWHNNCNCPGQNLLLTYSKTGNGYFEYVDPVSKEIIRMEDRPGWTAKVGYYGSDKEPDKIIWHCARTYEPRITISYVVRDQSMWEFMVEDIQSDQ